MLRKLAFPEAVDMSRSLRGAETSGNVGRKHGKTIGMALKHRLFLYIGDMGSFGVCQGPQTKGLLSWPATCS